MPTSKIEKIRTEQNRNKERNERGCVKKVLRRRKRREVSLCQLDEQGPRLPACLPLFFLFLCVQYSSSVDETHSVDSTLGRDEKKTTSLTFLLASAAVWGLSNWRHLTTTALEGTAFPGVCERGLDSGLATVPTRQQFRIDLVVDGDRDDEFASLRFVSSSFLPSMFAW